MVDMSKRWKTRRRSINNLIMIIFFIMCCCSSWVAEAAENEADLQKECSDELSKVYSCLDFATGKGSSPSSSCCSSVSDIRGKDPVCLCFIIQQAHNSSAAVVKSLGLQFERLLQLPDACKLANASLTNCPKLLNLPANSPDNAIFANATKASFTPSSLSPSSNVITPSKGAMHQIPLDSIFTLAVVSAIILSIFKGTA